MSKTTPKKYEVTFKFNGETKTKRTDDILAVFDEVRPPLLHTEMYITVKNGKSVMERRFNLIQARKLFRDNVMKQVFLSNLLLA